MQIGAVRERAVRTLIDRVPGVGGRIEKQKQEQQRSDHAATVQIRQKEIYETLVQGMGSFPTPQMNSRATFPQITVPPERPTGNAAGRLVTAPALQRPG
jgi:hypothetical protein